MSFFHSLYVTESFYASELEFDDGGGKGDSFRASDNNVSICFSFNATCAIRSN
jgi:hypothetical protein